MSGSHITQPRDRQSKKYLALHAELAREVAVLATPRSLAHRSAKQISHFAKSELYRLFGDTP